MLQWLKKEFFHILPVLIFFLITFNIFNLIERILFEPIGYHPFSFWEIFLAVALIAKIILVLDHLPWINLFSTYPLIYNTLWKTLVYWTVTLLVRLSLRMAPFIIQEKSFSTGTHAFLGQMNWHLFAGVNSYYLLLLFFFVIARELITVLGPLKVRKLFFGK